MLNFIENNRENFISDLAGLIKIPSVAAPKSEKYIYGKSVNEALDFITNCAINLGLDAENLGYAAKISLSPQIENAKTLVIAAHADVVPGGGEGWKNPPYELVRKDGYLYGRGVLDDKGAAVAALYALAAVKNTEKQPKINVNLLIGGDEESGMSDMKAYVKNFGLPDFALTPDAGFPIINAELGYIFGRFIMKNVECDGNVKLIKIIGGTAENCVAESCYCEILGDKSVYAFLKSNENMLLKPKIDYSDENIIKISCKGVSAHGSVPEKGRSAVLDTLRLLEKTFKNFGSTNSFLTFTEHLIIDNGGKSLKIDCEDEFSGKLSSNFGLCEYQNGNATLSLDVRVPISFKTDNIVTNVANICKLYGVDYQNGRNGDGIRFPENSPFLRSVAASYQKVLGKECGFHCERGSTYAKAFQGRCVAFGPAVATDREICGNIHAPNEYIKEEALIEMAKIYAQTIFDFCL